MGVWRRFLINRGLYGWPKATRPQAGLFGWPLGLATPRYDFAKVAEITTTDSTSYLGSHTINLPTTEVVIDDVMIACVSCGLGTEGGQTLTGFTQLNYWSENSCLGQIYYRRCDGTETSTTTFTLGSGTAPASAIVIQMKGGFPYTAATTQDLPKNARWRSNVDPPPLTPGRGGNINFVYFAFASKWIASDATDPGGYDYYAKAGSSTSRTAVGIINKRTATYDPPSFGGGGTSNCITFTVALPPAGVSVF